MGRQKSNHVEEEAKMALEYFRRKTTSNGTVNGILRSSEYRFESLTRKMMYQLNYEYRKCIERDKVEEELRSRPAPVIIRRKGADVMVKL